MVWVCHIEPIIFDWVLILFVVVILSDLPRVDHVINYEMPKEMKEYIHRIGRTGRLGRPGRSTSFYDPEANSQLADQLAECLRNANQEVPDFLSGGGDPFSNHDNHQGNAVQAGNAAAGGDDNWDDLDNSAPAPPPPPKLDNADADWDDDASTSNNQPQRPTIAYDDNENWD